jgi:hypothetical protein
MWQIFVMDPRAGRFYVKKGYFISPAFPLAGSPSVSSRKALHRELSRYGFFVEDALGQTGQVIEARSTEDHGFVF